MNEKRSIRTHEGKKIIRIVSRTFPGSFTIFPALSQFFGLFPSERAKAYSSTVRTQLKMASGKIAALGHLMPSGRAIFPSGIFQLLQSSCLHCPKNLMEVQLLALPKKMHTVKWSWPILEKDYRRVHVTKSFLENSHCCNKQNEWEKSRPATGLLNQADFKNHRKTDWRKINRNSDVIFRAALLICSNFLELRRFTNSSSNFPGQGPRLISRLSRQNVGMSRLSRPN